MSDDMKEQVTSLLSALFASADSRGPAAAAGFAGCFTEHGQFKAGPQAALQGRKGKKLRATFFRSLFRASVVLTDL